MNIFLVLLLGEDSSVGQSWTGGLAQGCAPVFQPFGEPGNTGLNKIKNFHRISGRPAGRIIRSFLYPVSASYRILDSNQGFLPGQMCCRLF